MSISRYPEYKDSGVNWLGQVPKHWVLMRIGSCFAERREKVSDKLFPALSVTKGGIVPQIETAAKTDDGDNRKKVLKGDFVINSRSDRKGSAGISDIDGSVSLICTVLKPLSQMDAMFVHHLLRSQPFQEEFYRNGRGIVADLWSTPYGEMRSILLAVPPATEQTAIANFLDRETAKIDALVAEQQRLIELLKEKRQAVISRAVTKGLNPNAPMKPSGIEWLGDVPAHWRIEPLKHSITRIEQGWSPQCESRPAAPDEWGVLKVGCGNGDVFDPAEQKALPLDLVPLPEYEIRPGDILLSRGNTLELVGAATFIKQVRPRLMLSDLLYRFRAQGDRADPEFLVLWLRSPGVRFQIERAATGTSASMKKISQGTIHNITVCLPPLDEQREVVSFLAEKRVGFGRLIAESQGAIDLLQERRTALISAAVTGQVDVRNHATA